MSLVRPTQEDVDASTNSTISRIKKHGEKLMPLLEDEPGKIANSSASPVEKNQRLFWLVQEISNYVAPLTPCSKGCSHCCKMAVGITDYEADLIGKHIGVKPREVRIHPAKLKSMVQDYNGVSCPFLKKGVCSIYEVRPLACRTHYNLSAYATICDLNHKPPFTIPNLNFSTLWSAHVEINAGTYNFGDIRHYFPDGFHTEQEL